MIKLCFIGRKLQKSGRFEELHMMTTACLNQNGIPIAVVSGDEKIIIDIIFALDLQMTFLS